MSNHNATNDTGSTAAAVAAKVGNYRWMICALLFFCTTINYVDRNSLSVLKTTLQGALGWEDVDYGTITTAFTFAYAMFPSVIGIIIDKIGVKKALAWALIVWSLAAAAHGLVATVLGFVIVRFILGFAEAANFPASIKAVGMWFPQKERALATGIFNSGTSIGVIVSGVIVWIALHLGWQMSFVAIGAVGLLWLYFWQRFFTDPEHQPRLGASELAYIRSDQPQAQQALKLSWTTLMRYREIWPFLIGKLITDPVWWFYLFWLPSYLDRERGQNPLNAGIWVAVIYTGSSVGSILGGWISSALMKRGWPVGKARMTAMGLAAIFMPGSILAYYTESFAVCVAFITLATACHQAWSANLFTNATDLFPQKVSGSVVGLGATAGGIGGMFMTLLAGLAVQWTGNQQIVFVWAGTMHILALALFWIWFKGRFVQIDVDTPLDVSRTHGGLAVSGVIVAAVGAALAALVTANWGYLVDAVKITGAVQSIVVAAAVFLIGVALFYASRPQKTVAR
ncbi:MAG TPA: MFS transporter [Steroidobacteraceae bacterium]|jgi:ACS family hexuronate transporter-like MFS transporter|nr:MFS transporter [Steroidobacteraceae bacterium]